MSLQPWSILPVKRKKYKFLEFGIKIICQPNYSPMAILFQISEEGFTQHKVLP
jgi:hypothetical protein